MGIDPFSGVRIFVQSAESGSFTRAALQLGLTPSAVSKAVARLERELGLRLFHRSPRQVALTADGEAFYAECRAGLRMIEEARSRAANRRESLRGRVRMCTSTSFGQYVLGPALGAWLARYPALELDLVLTDRHVDLAAERFDLTVRLGEVRDSRLVVRRLPPHRFLTAAAPAYLRRHGEPVRPGHLVRHACLQYIIATTGRVREWTFRKEGRISRHYPAGPAATDHASVLVDLALVGRGIVQAPAYVLNESITSGGLRQVLADHDSIGAPLSLAYPRARHPDARVQAVIDFVLECGSRVAEKAARY